MSGPSLLAACNAKRLIACENHNSQKLSVAATGHSRKPRSYEGLKGAGSGSGKRLHFCRRVFKESARGDLVVPERVDVCPLLLKPTACLFDDASLVTHDDDHVALRDELARLELLEFKSFPDQGVELLYSLTPTESASERDYGGALQGPFHVLGEEV